MPHCDNPYNVFPNVLMYIIAIGWIYVVLLMSLTEPSVVAGLATLFFYGLAPLAVFLYVVGTPARRRRKKRAQEARQQATADTEKP